ncbi:glycoside hydrolase family 18 protein [Pleomassaria siparia CBS 279.74]|uniref:chitinase n=1 Tax=Pleomassaria siparia CBS 279.74 TaxID=1314801 RepID=A0A6G1JUG5_9PLEO|nr:glycoside hydrolase family 18 protein [Pleomassaria siparia CBS 279.74]
MGGGDGYRSVAYFTNWSIYGRKYFPKDIPVSKLTHILYAFADNNDQGEVFLTDKWSDCDIHWPPGDSWNDSGNNLYGCLKQLAIHKKANRNLKTLLSIGGWTYTQISKHLDGPASTPEGRKRFADSCVKLIKDLGFDGIDVDWEYPANPEQGQHLLLLLREIRCAMDEYAETLAGGYGGEKPKFLLSIAAPAGAAKYANYPLREIGEVLDFVNLMAYDFAGSWDAHAGHHANLYHANSCPTSTPFNTAGVIQAYIAAGIPSSKMVLGQPLYGRAYKNTAGIGKPFSGIGDADQERYSWEAGVWDFKALPHPGATEYIDEEAGASYSFEESTGTLISYDNEEIARRKAEYIKQNNLGGAMWWELSGDRPLGEGSLIETVANSLGGPDCGRLDQSKNWLNYPDSQYNNLKEGFP